MTLLFLIDACLSAELADRAKERGHEATHVRFLGKGDWKDWSLRPVIEEGDYTFVTVNAVDFRGPKGDRGKRGQHAEMELHAGLVCLNAPQGMDLDLQLELFEAALDELDADPEILNIALEVTLENSDDLRFLIERYAIPKEGPYAAGDEVAVHYRDREE